VGALNRMSGSFVVAMTVPGKQGLAFFVAPAPIKQGLAFFVAACPQKTGTG